MIVNELGCEVSIPKADLVATSNKLRRRVGKALEQFGHKWPTNVAVNLGIDMTGGTKRSKHLSKKLAERLAKQKLWEREESYNLSSVGRRRCDQ